MINSSFESINYIINSTVNINIIYDYVKTDDNISNEIKLKLYPDGTVEITNNKSKNNQTL